MLDEGDTYCCFDFGDRLKAFVEDLQARDFGIKCQIIASGNSSKLWDSYNWNLSKLVFKMREHNKTGLFDAVYLDGAHTFFHDGLAVCLLKELIKDGGFLVLDDLYWSFVSAKIDRTGHLTKEQMNDYQILRVQELFLTPDPNWEKLSPPNAWRGVFRKRPCLTKEENLS